MKTKVNYNELNELSNYIVSKKEEIDLVLQDINGIINSVETVWNGKDCKEFIKEANKKINEEQEKNKKLQVFADNLKTAANSYSSFEEKWHEEAKRESLENE